MKNLLILLITSASTSLFAAVNTKLNIPSEPSQKSIKKAIILLKKASAGTDKSYNLKNARKLISITTKKVRFNAAVYIAGDK